MKKSKNSQQHKNAAQQNRNDVQPQQQQCPNEQQ